MWTVVYWRTSEPVPDYIRLGNKERASLTDEELEARLYRPALPRSSHQLAPDFALVHQEDVDEHSGPVHDDQQCHVLGKQGCVAISINDNPGHA